MFVSLGTVETQIEENNRGDFYQTALMDIMLRQVLFTSIGVEFNISKIVLIFDSAKI